MFENFLITIFFKFKIYLYYRNTLSKNYQRYEEFLPESVKSNYTKYKSESTAWAVEAFVRHTQLP